MEMRLLFFAGSVLFGDACIFQAAKPHLEVLCELEDHGELIKIRVAFFLGVHLLVSLCWWSLSVGYVGVHLLELNSVLFGKVKYVARPVLPFGCQSKSGHYVAVGTNDPVNLGGYGVELALKNMEYKAMDDSAIKKGVQAPDRS